MVVENESHSTDRKASDSIYKKTWMKLTSPAAGSLGKVFFGLSAVVTPEIMAAEKEGIGVTVQEDDKSNGTKTVEEYSVKVSVFNTTPTPPQRGTKSGDAQVTEATSGAKPEAAPPSRIVVAGTPGAQKYIKVLRAYRIVLLGKTGSGKSSLGNRIFGEDVFKRCGANKCQIQSKSVHDRRITLVETPGFSDTDQPEECLKDEIVRCTTECAPGPHAFLIVLKMEESTEQQLSIISKIKQYFPEEVFKYATVVFTHGDQFHDENEKEQCVSHNIFPSDLVKKCSGRYHIVNNKCKLDSDDNKLQMSQLLSTIDKLVTENKGGCYTNKMLEVQKREKNNGAHKNMWIRFSGPEGMLVAEAFFGPAVTVLQKNTRVAVNEESKLPNEQLGENGATGSDVESEAGEKGTPTNKNLEVNEGREGTESETEKDGVAEESSKTVAAKNNTDNTPEPKQAARETENNGNPTGKTEQGGDGRVSENKSGDVLGGALPGAAAAAGAFTAGLSAAGGAAVLTGVGGVAGAGSGAGAGVAGATSGVVKIVPVIGTVAAAVGGGMWIKNKIQQLNDFYNMIKQNLGIILLVVAFYLLLVFSFCVSVPMAGTFFLLCGVVVLLLLIMLLLVVITQ